MSTTREPCGCKHDGRKWLLMCPTHEAEHVETHQRWNAEHIERTPDVQREAA